MADRKVAIYRVEFELEVEDDGTDQSDLVDETVTSMLDDELPRIGRAEGREVVLEGATCIRVALVERRP